ncbi:MAG TPA: YdcF family protein [Rhizomicrobium sp.]|nr:YdcF family protein [Rhizomicrobium sp.]
MRGFLLALILIVLAYVLGFVSFITLLPKAPADLKGADGVVVLTGGETRLDRAVALFESGAGKRLLISGVDQTTTKDTLKHLLHGGPRFQCCADLGYAAEDTHGNAQEAADWARAHNFHRLILVTARYHMPRALKEFSAAMPSVELLPYPVEQDRLNLADWWEHPRTIFLLHREYVKYLASLITTRMAKA